MPSSIDVDQSFAEERIAWAGFGDGMNAAFRRACRVSMLPTVLAPSREASGSIAALAFCVLATADVQAFVSLTDQQEIATFGSLPDITTDGVGTWVLPYVAGSADVVAVRSQDAGRSWTTPVSLGAAGIRPVVTTDGTGTWLVAFSSTATLGGTIGSDFDVLLSRSTDGGATWTAATALDSSAAADDDEDDLAELRMTPGGTALAVWQSARSDDMRDLKLAKSTDAGSTWSDPVSLQSSQQIWWPFVETDGVGTWLVAWEGGDGESSFPHRRIFLVRSTDDGATWSAPAAINTNYLETLGSFRPKLATDGSGTWVAVWISDIAQGSGARGDLFSATSIDNGLTWSESKPMHPHSTSDEEHVRVVTHGGDWIAIWHTDNPLSSGIKSDFDIVAAYSRNAGLSWSAPAVVNLTATGAGCADRNDGGDRFPRLATDASGTWIGVWQKGPRCNHDAGVLAAVSRRDCPVDPTADCSVLIEDDRARFGLGSKPARAAGLLKWRLSGAAGVGGAAFGDPLTSTAYSACVYESDDTVRRLVFEADIAASSQCGDAPCWTQSGDAFRYRDKKSQAGNVSSLQLRARDQVASIKLKAKSPFLLVPDGPLSLEPRVDVVLVNQEQGVCWRSSFAAASSNKQGRFRAKSD